MQEAPRPQDLRFTRHRRPAPVVLRGARPTCGTCGRRSHGQPKPPDFEHMRTMSPGNYKREMQAIRCPGCHRRFLNGVPTTPTYRLMEAT